MAKQSGISDTPTFLPYPSILKIEEFDGIKTMFSYVLEHYGSDGIACMIFHDPKQKQIKVQLGDWAGNVINLGAQDDPLAELGTTFLKEHGDNLLKLMKAAAIPQALYYLTLNADRKFKLVDVRVSFNKFLGPGMLRDVFGKIIETPKVLTIENISDDVLNALLKGTGKFSGDLILKPSRYRTVDWNGVVSPLYVEIIR